MLKNKKYKIMRWHHISHVLAAKHVPLLPRLMHVVGRIVFGCSIPPEVTFGEGTLLAHNGLGVVIAPEVVIGKECTILHHVTIGGKNGQTAGKIGDYCFIGVGACILGEVTIGNDVMIGANAVVVHDVPDGTIVAGVPAKVIGKVSAEWIGKRKR